MDAPTRIGPYEILREIGRGGMGIVYLAREPDEGSVVALKVLPREWTEDTSEDTSRLKRFQREAATVMKIRHPNIVPIYSVGSAGGVWFIAMKYIDGTSLDVLIRQHARSTRVPHDHTVVLPRRDTATPAAPGPQARTTEVAVAPRQLTVEVPDGSRLNEPEWAYRSVQIVENVARALAHLHQQGIIHRDIKPANILIDGFGDAWLTDFGLVRDAESPLSKGDGIVGTMQYLAPEQVRSGKGGTDHRSDIYSLGVTLYELVTLKRPFDGGDPSSILYAVARENPVPPRKINSKITDDLQRVIHKAMAKNPDARYQNGIELAEDLRRVRAFEPVRATRRTTVFFARLRRLTLKRLASSGVAVLSALLIVLASWCIHAELRDRKRLLDCKAEADVHFESQHFEEAADGYRVFLKLGGDDPAVRQRLAYCKEALESETPR